MKMNYCPILVVPAFMQGEEIRFLQEKVQIDYSCPVKDVWNILKYCNGKNNVEEIADYTNLDKAFIVQTISDLKESDIVIGDKRHRKQLRRINEMQSTAEPHPEDEDTLGTIRNVLHPEAHSRETISKAAIGKYRMWAANQRQVAFRGTAKQITGRWLDPRQVVPFSSEQLSHCGLKQFTEDLVIDWTRGVDYDGEEILVPTDLVYRSQNDMDDHFCYGNRSGIAVGYDYIETKRNAILDLIARDAIMKNWLTKESPNIINERILPDQIRKHIANMAQDDRRMIILKVKSEYGIVFETVIVSDKYPCFVYGVAATADARTMYDTILRSILEAEESLEKVLRHPNRRRIKAKKVQTPTDHGRFYHFKENADTLRWLWEGKRVINCLDVRIDEYYLNQTFDDRLKLVTVNMLDHNSNIKAVRVFSPYLVTIDFGFYSIHHLHPSIRYKMLVNQDNLKMPHYFDKD